MAILVYSSLEKASSYLFSGAFGMVSHFYLKKYGIPFEKLKKQMAMVVVKNHKNGAINQKAQFRKEKTYTHGCTG